ncbi:DNA-directed RNA polymerase II, large subunit [Burkholderia pseudomallei]|nr:DNA-directed RNA polymerase II, large subunit [Burkholderia pseudomallei]
MLLSPDAVEFVPLAVLFVPDAVALSPLAVLLSPDAVPVFAETLPWRPDTEVLSDETCDVSRSYCCENSCWSV